MPPITFGRNTEQATFWPAASIWPADSRMGAAGLFALVGVPANVGRCGRGDGAGGAAVLKQL